MTLVPRYLEPSVRDDLTEKMVFIGGPRQVGKSSLARRIAGFYPRHSAFNWDDAGDRRLIRAGRFDPEARLLVFDEIHKFHGWRNHVKGLYDKNKDRVHILVTGSARLDVYRRGGDSLLGRYHHHRLHPFSVAEILTGASPSRLPAPFSELEFSSVGGAWGAARDLLSYGGFPEPFARQDLRRLRRWHLSRMERLIAEDIRDTETLHDLGKLEHMADLLPTKVGGLFSLNSLREDLEVTHRTLSHWVEVLERFYVHFRIRPYHAHLIKSLRKEPKLYLWDWSQVPGEAARLENLVAGHLLKFTHRLHDAEGHRAELFFLRDIDGREVDFLVAVDRRPWFAVEVKTSPDSTPRALTYFGQRLKIPRLYQVVLQEKIDFLKEGIRTINVAKFLSALA